MKNAKLKGSQPLGVAKEILVGAASRWRKPVDRDSVIGNYGFQDLILPLDSVGPDSSRGIRPSAKRKIPVRQQELKPTPTPVLNFREGMVCG